MYSLRPCACHVPAETGVISLLHNRTRVCTRVYTAGSDACMATASILRGVHSASTRVATARTCSSIPLLRPSFHVRGMRWCAGYEIIQRSSRLWRGAHFSQRLAQLTRPCRIPATSLPFAALPPPQIIPRVPSLPSPPSFPLLPFLSPFPRT